MTITNYNFFFKSKDRFSIKSNTGFNLSPNSDSFGEKYKILNSL